MQVRQTIRNLLNHFNQSRPRRSPEIEFDWAIKESSRKKAPEDALTAEVNKIEPIELIETSEPKIDLSEKVLKYTSVFRLN